MLPEGAANWANVGMGIGEVRIVGLAATAGLDEETVGVEGRPALPPLGPAPQPAARRSAAPTRRMGRCRITTL